MKKALVFLAATAVALPVFADDLLDEVLRWKVPIARPEQTQGGSGNMPAPPQTTGEALLEKKASSSQQGWNERESPSAYQKGDLSHFENVETQKVAWTLNDETISAKVLDDNSSATGIEQRGRLNLRGGGGSGAIAAGGELTLPLWESPFDLSLRGFYAKKDYMVTRSYKETYYSYSYETYVFSWLGHKHTRTVYYETEECFESYGAETLALWRPFRGQFLSPYVGVGGCYSWAENKDDEGADIAWCVGATLNVWRLWLKGEYAGGKAVDEINGTLGYRLGQHVALEVFAERLAGNGSDGAKQEAIIGGGGLTLIF